MHIKWLILLQVRGFAMLYEFKLNSHILSYIFTGYESTVLDIVRDDILSATTFILHSDFEVLKWLSRICKYYSIKNYECSSNDNRHLHYHKVIMSIEAFKYLFYEHLHANMFLAKIDRISKYCKANFQLILSQWDFLWEDFRRYILLWKTIQRSYLEVAVFSFTRS